MYYLVYFILRGLSLLPLQLLYLLSDFIYVILYYLAGYRKDVVLKNLKIAFPEKSEAERKKIMKAFYHQFCYSFAEMIKIFSWDEKEICRRMKGNMEVINEWAGKEQSLQIVLGHYFNWELANLSWAANMQIPFLGVYAPLKNKTMDRIVRKLRSKTGTILIPANDFKRGFVQNMKKQYVLGLVADQNPRKLDNAWWMRFFGKAVPIVKGPAKASIARNTVVIYADFYKVKRGYYEYKMELITSTPADFSEEELARLIIKKIEDSIRARPANYLWTHRRWKREWKNEYSTFWIDTTPVPEEN